MKKNNPTIPIMLRDAAGTSPKVYARYGMSGQDEVMTPTRGIRADGWIQSSVKRQASH
jgi:hypothetical protein